MNPTPALLGWDWLKGGFAMLRRQPAGLLTTFYGYTLVVLLLSVIQAAGFIVIIVTMPVFTIGFLQAARQVIEGKPVRPGTLLTGFRKPAVWQLCRLGGATLLCMFVLTPLVILPFTDWEALRAAGQLPAAEAVKMLPQVVPPACFVVLQLLAAVLVFVVNFAAPLIFWKDMKPAKAMFYSFFAIKRAAGAFAVFVLVFIAINVAVQLIFTLLFGGIALGQALGSAASVVLMGVGQTALYLPYVHIFGAPPADPEPAPKA